MTKCSIPYCSNTICDKYKRCLKCREKGREYDKKRRLPKPCSSGEQQCKCCGKVLPKNLFKPNHSQTKLTTTCLTCRDSLKRSIANSTANTKAAWETWQKENSKCLCCGVDDARVIKADHQRDIIHKCDDYSYWSNRGGVEAQKKELLKCRPLCCFCYTIKSNKRHAKMRRCKLIKCAIINIEKIKRESCLHCKRVPTNDTFCAFSFNHRNLATRVIQVADLINKPWSYFNEHAVPEIAKCDLLCANCYTRIN